MQLPSSPEERIAWGAAVTFVAGLAGTAVAAWKGAFKKGTDEQDKREGAHDALRLKRDESQTDTSIRTLKDVEWFIGQMKEEIARKALEIADLKQELEDFKLACSAEIAALKGEVKTLQAEIGRLRGGGGRR